LAVSLQFCLIPQHCEYMGKLLSFVAMLLFFNTGTAQTIYSPIANVSLYEFLDELANLKVIDLNTAVKPYSRLLIGTKLQEAADSSKSLNKRQLEEVRFYLKDFNKEHLRSESYEKRRDLYYYKDSLFTLTVNPIFGVQVWNNKSGSALHRWGGGELFGSVGKHWGFYANLRDNFEDNMVGNELYRTHRLGGNYKSIKNNSAEYSEMRGGLTYSSKWASIGLIKDRFTWGNNYHGSNILSGRTPSFAHIKLNIHPVKWLDFNYVHGWLASEVVDSTQNYVAGARNRNVMVGKYIAANLVTVAPMKGLKISIGNSIVYSDVVHLAYFIPFLFYKSVDHTVNYGGGNYGGENAQMFLDISSRQIKGVHLFGTIFIDEISIKRMWNAESHSNFASLKGGGAWSNIFNSNATLILEYTRTNPVTYRHFVSTTTFESNGYNMGHYLRDNAQEFAVSVIYRPIPNFRVEVKYITAVAGEIYEYTGINNSGLGLPFLESPQWYSDRTELRVSYEIINDLRVFGGYEYSEIRGDDNFGLYTEPYYHGIQNTFSIGINLSY